MPEKEINLKINTKIFWYLVLALLIIFFGVLIFRTLFLYEKYVGVYLLNGDLYIGKLSYFPKMKLSDPYLLRIDDQGNNILVPLTQLTWQPKNYLYLNKDQILWIAPLVENSQALSLIKNKSSLNQNPLNFYSQPQNFIQTQPPVNQPPIDNSSLNLENKNINNNSNNKSNAINQ